MTTNFKILTFTEIEFNGRELDLHNNFSFVSFIHNEAANELVIQLEKAIGDWVPQNESKKLTFTLSNIHYLKSLDPKPEYISDDHCLAGITFYGSGDRDENFSLVDQPLPKAGDDIIFTFESDRVIRVNCDSVTLTTN